MSLKEYLIEKKQIELNHKESTDEAVAVLKQAADWLKGRAERPSTEHDDVKDLVAKALTKVGCFSKEDVKKITEPEKEPETTEEEIPEEDFGTDEESAK